MEPFLGQIQIFGFNFAPRGWAFCNGQILPISQNSALFSLLGTQYGGDGRVTFALPDLRSRVPVHFGTGPGLSAYSIGQPGGQESASLTEANLPAHSHAASLKLGAGPGLNAAGNGGYLADNSAGETIFTGVAPSDAQLAAGSLNVLPTGGNQAFDIRNPFLGMNYCVALQGLFPSRN